jgi:hypothetical protein
MRRRVTQGGTYVESDVSDRGPEVAEEGENPTQKRVQNSCKRHCGIVDEILRAKIEIENAVSSSSTRLLPFRGGPGRTFVGAAPTGAKARASPETSPLLPSRVMSSPESKKLLGARFVPPRARGLHHPKRGSVSTRSVNNRDGKKAHCDTPERR